MSVRVRNGRMRLQSLRDFSTQLHNDAMEDDKEIDFSSVGLYISGLQIVFAIGATATISVLCCWILPSHTISAVRTLAICSICGLSTVKTPLRVGRVRGVSTVFNALRPSVVVYLLALVLEQLVHTCLPSHATSENAPTLRYAIYHTTSALMVLAGFVRARAPRSESDVAFLMAATGVVGAALLPPPGTPQHGPLCEEATLLEAGERVVRAVLFAATYVVLVYASAPTRNTANELFVCVARTVAASIWVLTATTWLLPLAVVQIVLVLYTRLREDDGHSAPPSPSAMNGRSQQFERIPLHDSMTPERNGGSDVDAFDTAASAHMLDVEALVAPIARLPSHAAQRHALHSPYHHTSNANNGTPSHSSLVVSQAPGFSFSILSGAPVQRTPSVNLAAIAAREARNEGNVA